MQQRLETKIILRIELGVESCTWFGRAQRTLVEAHLDRAPHVVFVAPWSWRCSTMLEHAGGPRELYHVVVTVHFLIHDINALKHFYV